MHFCKRSWKKLAKKIQKTIFCIYRAGSILYYILSINFKSPQRVTLLNEDVWCGILVLGSPLIEIVRVGVSIVQNWSFRARTEWLWVSGVCVRASGAVDLIHCTWAYHMRAGKGKEMPRRKRSVYQINNNTLSAIKENDSSHSACARTPICMCV